MVATRSKSISPVAAARPPGSPQLALVTGGSGFLGRHIVEQLLATGRYSVRVFDIRRPDDADARVEYLVGDLRKPEEVAAACRGAAVVFHVATASPTGANAYNHDLMRGVNVDGTQNVVDACVREHVPALVYTSSASVVFSGKDLVDVDESTPYAARPMDYYTVTKIEGEKAALAGNGRGGLATCALRPSGIFGEYDMLTVPTTIDNARRGKMKFIVGNGRNKMDFTYAGNVAAAHLAAAEALRAGGPAAGKAFFVTNDDPQPFWGFMGDICEGLGYGRPRIPLPFALVMFIACLMQYIIIPLLSPIKRLQTDFTPFRITLAASNRTFSCQAAKRDLGYRPAVGMEEAMRRTLAYFQHLHADREAEAPKKAA